MRLLHRALSGAVTVDNLDYVRRDARMCGVGLGPIDVDRLIYYTFCTADGLTSTSARSAAPRLPQRALLHVRERVLPPHRARHRPASGRDLPADDGLILPQSPLDDPGTYRRLSEWSLFTTVEAWLDEPLHSLRRELAEEWQSIIHRHIKYSMVYEHHVERQQPLPAARDLTREEFHAAIVRRLLPALRDLEFVVDIASQDPRPLNPFVGPKRLPVYDPATDRIEEQLLGGILEFVPAKVHLYRVFAVGREHERELALAAQAARSRRGGAAEPRQPRRRPSVSSGLRPPAGDGRPEATVGLFAAAPYRCSATRIRGPRVPEGRPRERCTAVPGTRRRPGNSRGAAERATSTPRRRPAVWSRRRQTGSARHVSSRSAV